jgi:hypothetical protein
VGVETKSALSEVALGFLRLGAERGAEERIGGGSLAPHGLRDLGILDQSCGRLKEDPVAGAGSPADSLIAQVVSPAGCIESIDGSSPARIACSAPVSVKEGCCGL